MNEPILNFVVVDDIDAGQADVERLGGRITMPKKRIAGVGQGRDDPGHRRKWYRHLEAGTEVARCGSFFSLRHPLPQARKCGGSAAMSGEAGTMNPVARELPAKLFARHLCITEMLRKKLLLQNNQSGSGQDTWPRRGREWKLFRK